MALLAAAVALVLAAAVALGLPASGFAADAPSGTGAGNDSTVDAQMAADAIEPAVADDLTNTSEPAVAGEALRSSADGSETVSASVASKAVSSIEAGLDDIPLRAALAVQSADVSSILGEGDELFLFGMDATAGVPQLDEDRLATLVAAVDALSWQAPCSLVLFDVSTGCGVAYHPEQQVFTASCVKAVLCYYIVTTAEASGSILSEQDRDDIEAAITMSDNSAHERLIWQYCNQRYYDWLAAYDDSGMAMYYQYFPCFSARSLAAVWTDIYAYLQQGGPGAVWLSDLFSRTETSFLRRALLEAGVDAKVWNKAGWVSDEIDFCTSDAGIVQIGGRDYIMAVATEQQWSETAEAAIADVVLAFVQVRDAFQGGAS